MIEMQMPVVRIAIVGAAMPKGRSWPRRGRPPIRVRYGEASIPREDESHQDLSLRMQRAIAELFDEDRTSWWEARAARRTARPPDHRSRRPSWLRVWEGSRPIRRHGHRPTWR